MEQPITNPYQPADRQDASEAEQEMEPLESDDESEEV